MLAECLEVFQDMLDKSGDDLILSRYIPDAGTYVIVQEAEGQLMLKSYVELEYDKKKGEIMGRTHTDYQDLLFYDYHSKLIDMNKPMGVKKIIHSNNYLSFFVKKDSLTNGKLNQDVIESYYDVLLHPVQKYNKPKAAEREAQKDVF